VGELLGLAVAAAFGSADFFGALASRRAPVVTVVFAQQLSGLVLAVAVVFVIDPSGPPARDVVLSAGAGIGAMVGLSYLYRGLALGRISVVAPLSAAGSAVLEVAWGYGRGERPGAPVIVGGTLVLVAVGIIAAGRGDDHPEVSRVSEVLFAAGAAVGFAASFVLLAETSARSGLWPVVVARCAAVVVLAVRILWTGRPALPDRRDLRPVAASGWLDAGANMVLLVAVRRDLLSVVAPLAALYPAATVLLARVVLRERVTRRRTIGLLVALAGLVVIGSR
jgi:drug/metabolite transporter (DMT)-like permease